MLDNLTLWFNIVQRRVSASAFIDGDNVYVRNHEDGIIDLVPLFDADLVNVIMDENPHLLHDTYIAWTRDGDETFSVAQTFCRIFHEQEVEHERFMDEMSPNSQASFEAAAKEIAAALADFLGGGAQVLAFPELPPSLAQGHVPLSVFQNGMFNRQG